MFRLNDLAKVLLSLLLEGLLMNVSPVFGITVEYVSQYRRV